MNKYNISSAVLKQFFALSVLTFNAILGNSAFAQQCAIPGKDAVATVTSAPNTYYSGGIPGPSAGQT